MATVVFDKQPRLIQLRIAAQEALCKTGHTRVYLHCQNPALVCAIEQYDPGNWKALFPHQIFGYGKNSMVFPGNSPTIPVEAARCALAFMFSEPVREGASFSEVINQGERFCTVIAVKRTRYRQEWDMPKAGIQQGWRHGIRVCGTLYYPGDEQTPTEDILAWMKLHDKIKKGY